MLYLSIPQQYTVYIRLSICTSVCMSMGMSACLSLSLCVCVSLCASASVPSACLCLPACLPVCLYVRPSVCRSVNIYHMINCAPIHYIFFLFFGLLHFNKLVNKGCDSEEKLFLTLSLSLSLPVSLCISLSPLSLFLSLSPCNKNQYEWIKWAK